MAITLQCADVTATTDSNGGFDFTFDGPITQVLASPTQPQQPSTGGAIVCASATVTGTYKCHVRAFVRGPNNTVVPAASEQVTVTLLGVNQ